MAFKDFFTKRQKQPEPPEERTLTQKELADWLKQEQETYTKKEQEVVADINEHTKQLIEELQEHQEIISDVDISEAPVDKRAKTIVQGNINKYVFYTEQLQNKLLAASQDRLATRIHDLKELLTEFFTQSEPNYQKATFLVGTELAATKESVKTFAKYIEHIMHEQQELTEHLHNLDIIQEAYDELRALDEAIQDTNEELASTNEDIEALKARTQTITEEITTIKNSTRYKEQEAKNQQRETAKHKLEQDMQRLQRTIDFKALRGEFHTSKKHMKTVKELQKDFQTAYNKDNGTTLRTLLEEAHLLTKNLEATIEQVNEQHKRLRQQPQTKNKELARLTTEEQTIKQQITQKKQDVKDINKRQQKLLQQQTAQQETLGTTLKEQHIKIQHSL